MSGTRRGCRRWTPEEDETVRRHYPLHGPQWSGWEGLLPGRSYSAIVNRAGKLGVALAPELRSLAISRGLGGREGLWTPEEDALVAEHYPTRGPAWELWDELLARYGAHSPELFNYGCWEIENKRLGITFQIRGNREVY